jgi:hypothetical protein
MVPTEITRTSADSHSPTPAPAADRFRRRNAAGLDVAGDADAAQLAFRLGLGLAACKPA